MTVTLTGIMVEKIAMSARTGLLSRPLQSEVGLTLMEVIFAVVLFAGSMITLLGLQSSNTSRTREDREKIRAMLAAREILSAVEIQEDPLEPGSREGTVEEIFDGLVTKPQRDANDPDPHPGLTASLDIENMPLPDIGETALQKVTVSIYWGPGPFDVFRTTFFTPGKLLETQGSDEES